MVRRLLLLNGFAAIMVAFHHAAAYGLNSMFVWGNRNGAIDPADLETPAYLVTLTIRQIDGFAIPAFLFVSGFFLAFTAKGDSGVPKWSAIGRRIWTLIPPFLIWTVVVFALAMRPPRTLDEALGMYYYIPLLMQLLLLGPFLVRWGRRHWPSLLILTGLLQLFLLGFRYLEFLDMGGGWQRTVLQYTPLWFFPSRIFYFSLGIAAGLHVSAFKAWIQARRRLLFGLTVASVILAVVEYQVVNAVAGDPWIGPNFVGLMRTLYAVLFILMFLAYEEVKYPWARWIEEVGGQSLGVYLMNTPVIFVVSSLLFHRLPFVIDAQILYQPILILTGLFIPLAVMAVVKNTFFRFSYRTLFG